MSDETAMAIAHKTRRAISAAIGGDQKMTEAFGHVGNSLDGLNALAELDDVSLACWLFDGLVNIPEAVIRVSATYLILGKDGVELAVELAAKRYGLFPKVSRISQARRL